MKKWFLSFVAVIALMTLLVLIPSAKEKISSPQADTLALLGKGDFTLGQTDKVAQVRLFRSGGDLAGAAEAIKAGLSQFARTIDLTSYRLLPSELKTVLQDLINATPELFHMDKQYSYRTYSGGQVALLEPSYLCTQEEYEAKMLVYRAELDELLSYHDPSRTAAQSVVFYHDLLIDRYEYDQTEPYNYDVYSFFTEKNGVCQAYTLAFIAVMNELDIPCTYAESISMNHIWNLVQVNGNYYHVDLTWDDPSSSVPGQILHDLLLLSDGEIARSEHYDWIGASDILCTDTAFDRADWRSLTTSIVFAGGRLYGVDPNSGEIAEYRSDNGRAGAPIHTIEQVWLAGDGASYVMKYAGLVGNEGMLYFNTPTAVYLLDPISSLIQQVYQSEQEGQIFGLARGEDGMVCLLQSTDPTIGEQVYTTLPISYPDLPHPDYNYAIHLFDQSGFLLSCNNLSQAIGAMTDREQAYTIGLYQRASNQIFSLYESSLPNEIAKSITLRPLSGSLPLTLALGSHLSLGCDLTLHDLTVISSSASTVIDLLENKLTLSGDTSLGSDAAPISLIGGENASLDVRGEESAIRITGEIITGNLDLRGEWEICQSLIAKTMRVHSASTLTLSNSASMHLDELLGANELMLIPTTESAPVIEILSTADVLLSYLYPLSYREQIILIAPAFSYDHLNILSAIDGVTVTVTPLFEKTESGTFYRACDSASIVNDTTLISYHSILTDHTVLLPDTLTAIADGAFASAPGVKNILIPPSVTAIGAFALGFSQNGEEWVAIPDLTVRAQAGSVGATYAIASGISLSAWQVEIGEDFTYRYYENESIAELIAWNQSGAVLILPDTIRAQNGAVCLSRIGADLVKDLTEVSIYSPYESGSDRNPWEAEWQSKHSYFAKGRWYTLSLYLENTLLRSLPLSIDDLVANALVTPEKPTQNGVAYRFLGWDSDGDGIPSTLPERLSGDLALVAVFEPITNRLTMTWNDRFGNPILIQTLDPGQIIEPPTPPAVADTVSHTYRFIGWIGYEEGMAATADLSFTASYEEQVRQYTYLFLDDSGKTILSVTAPYATPITPPSAPSKESDGNYIYTFSHWQGYGESTVLDRDYTFTAVYLRTDANPAHPSTITSDLYTVSFGYIEGVSVQTSVGEMLSHLNESAHLQITTASGVRPGMDDIVGTGTIVTLLASDGKTPLRSFTVIVRGDLSGDGAFSITDFVRLKSHLLARQSLSEALVKAGDLSGDGVTSLTDFIRMKSLLLGQIG